MHVSLVGIQWEMESRFNTIQASLWVSHQLLTPPDTTTHPAHQQSV